MPKSIKAIAWVVAGLTLSTMLAGCGRHVAELQVEVPKPVAVVVKDTPAAELLRCPERPAGFPASNAVIPPDTRAAIIRLAKAYAMTVAQLERLIDWSRPGACKGPAQ